MGNEDFVFVVGHKNPDTDSICSAISLAYLKNQIEKTDRYLPRRAGQINEETEFVLKYFGIDSPLYMPNVGTQVKDMNIDETEGAPDDVTIRIAWEYMKESGISALPIMDSMNQLEGMITVSDITNYYMDSYTKTIMSEAKTKYYDIAETINGHVVVGNEEDLFTEGRVIVGAATPESFSRYMQPKDLVILGDRMDTQLTAIEMGASAIVCCLSGKVSDIVRMSAEHKNCVVICTKFDTYTVARLINQAIPAKFLMKKDGLISFHLDDFIDDIRETMGKLRHRSYPVLNHKDEYVGMIGSQNLLNAKKKHVILVDHTEVSQAVDNLDQAEILEIVDHHRVGTVETINPIYFRGEPVGCTCTILYSMFRENDIEIPKEIAGLMMSAIISDTLLFRSPTCTPRDQVAGLALAKIAGVNPGDYAKQMFRAGSALGNKTPDEILHLVEESNFSFPSGHAVGSMVFYGLAIWLVWHYVSNKRTAAVLTVLLCIPLVFVGMTRVYLGVHFPTDILAGWCIGAVAIVITAEIILAVERRRGALLTEPPAQKSVAPALKSASSDQNSTAPGSRSK